MEKPYFLPGSEVTRDQFNKLRAYLLSAGNLRIDPASGLKLIDIAGNRTLRMDRPRSIWGTLAGSGGPYTFTQALDGATSSWSSYPRTGNAYEVNSVAGLAGKVARLHPDGFGAYRFQWVKGGANVFCGCADIPLTLNLTIPAGFPYGGGTLASHTDTLTYAPGATPTPTWVGTCIGQTGPGVGSFFAHRFSLKCVNALTNSFVIQDVAGGSSTLATALANCAAAGTNLSGSVAVASAATPSPCGPGFTLSLTDSHGGIWGLTF